MDIDGRLRAMGIDKAEAERAVAEFIKQASPELMAAAQQKLQEAEQAERAARAQAVGDMSKTASSGAAPARRPRSMV
jgi:tartrate dehydratase alpha subunit/fumarate hydratase class I-like protein